MADVGVIGRAQDLIRSLAPTGQTVAIRVPLQADESEWFTRAVNDGLIAFGKCPTDCFRYKKWKVPGPDHFVTPAGKPRHLFSKPVGEVGWLSREYVPHIAAYAFAILGQGYNPGRSSFSRYRSYSRDLITKRQGATYETDAEFYDSDDKIYLHVEAKASGAQTDKLARQVREYGELSLLPIAAAKEIEYVLDLAPQYLWIVGPGSVDPPRHVFAVTVDGNRAGFRQMDGLPEPPTADVNGSVPGRRSDRREVPMSAEWLEAAEAAKVDGALIDLLSGIASGRGLHPCARGGSGEIGIGAAADAYAAFYISSRGITFALDPQDARGFAGAHDLSLMAKNSTTNYVTCPNARLSDDGLMARLRIEAERAWDRSWQGPRWARTGAASSIAKVAPTCPIHFYELSLSGYCMQCDDQAPSM